MGYGDAIGDAMGDFGDSISDAFGDDTTGDFSGGFDNTGAENGNYNLLNPADANIQEKKPMGLEDIQGGYADMLRSDYEDWQTRFKPFETLYQNAVLDPAKRAALDTEAMGFVGRGVNNAYGRSLAQMNKTDRQYGISLTDQEKASRNRNLLQRRGALEAKGRTDMRQALGNRRLQMLSGGIR